VSNLKHLDAVSRLLAGELPASVDWMEVLKLANETLVTPQLYAAALRTGAAERMPKDVQGFLAEVWRRNRARNRRLFAQLREAISMLNSAGVEPMLFKGAAEWALLGRRADHDRMMNDLDLIVQPQEEVSALKALAAGGFHVLKRSPPDSHWIAELGRPQDAGLLDLHRRPPGPSDLAREAMSAPGLILPLAWDGLRTKVPAPALQIFLTVLHDQFQDGGYWRGEFPLRHLLEIARFAQRPDEVDWPALARLARTRLTRNATDAQLLAAARLVGATPPGRSGRLWMRLQHARRRAQFGWPRLDLALRQLVA
jgi:hypothetical protein